MSDNVQHYKDMIAVKGELEASLAWTEKYGRRPSLDERFAAVPVTADGAAQQKLWLPSMT